MGHRVKHLMGCIEDVFKDAQVLGIKPVDLVGGPSRNVPVLEDVQLKVQRELVAGRGLIGRDQDEANILRTLCYPGNADRDLNVVGIVGMCWRQRNQLVLVNKSCLGLGKTALSKRVFDRDEVKKHFYKRIWVCVSHDFEVKGILEKMVELVDDETSTRSSYQAMVAKLEMNLRGKRYLLVLDDVWDTLSSVWESFRSMLLDIGGSKGTAVLATSRSSQAVARQEYLTLSGIVNMTKISSDVRHVCFLTEESPTPKLKEKLRTVMFESLYIGKLNNLLMHAKCLRVLSLVDAGLFKLPDSIGCFKHLRYLDISENDIMELPSSVGELYHLQTLRHLCFRVRYFSTYPTLPKELGKLVNLRCICTNRYSFKDFSLCILLEANTKTSQRLDQHQKWGMRISDISSLNNIRGSLALWYLEHVSSREEAKKASLMTKANIQHLDLTWSYNASSLTNSEEVLEELLPHENLKFLNIWYYDGQVAPSWLMEMRPSRGPHLCNLVEMKVYYCRNLKRLPTSLIFPFLKVLVVWGCDNLTSFPDLHTMESIEILKIGRCPLIEDLPNIDPLTNLSSLEIHNCARLTRLPEGFANLGNLTELDIGPLCRELDFFPFPDISDSCGFTKSLQKLSLIGWSSVGNLPNQLSHFTQLQTLSIGSFGSLKTLPSWLGNLTCLEIVHLQQMENLICLPSRNSMLRASRFRGFFTNPFQCPKLSISTDLLTVLLY
ncbi:hypothetical protein BVRB_5g116410 [Beta vulgaris subsp. vulgaris]|nr:hypothetical protein BVRB_5g116410 [Beta vulgaris subsp. vulgaris]